MVSTTTLPSSAGAGGSCSARLEEFAARLSRALARAPFADDASPAHILGSVVALAGGGDASGGGLSVLERGVSEAGLAAIAAGEGHSEDELRSAVLKAMGAYVDKRVVIAGKEASKAAGSLAGEKRWRTVGILAGSRVAAEAVRRITGLTGVSVIDAGPERAGRETAQKMSSTGGVRVQYGLLSATHDLLAGAHAVVLGAEEVSMHGSVVAGMGAGAVAAVAKELGVMVVVVAQTAKFSDAIVADVCVGGRDVLTTGEVDLIVTERGAVEPVLAASLRE